MPLNKSIYAVQLNKDKTYAMSLGAECYQCPYLDQPVVYSLRSENSSIAIVGITTTAEDIQKNDAFSGQAGILLNTALNQVGLKRENVLVTNACICRPRSGNVPTQAALDCCLPRLKTEVGGKTIITLGDAPRQMLVPETKDLKLNEIRGSWHTTELGEVLVTNHPNYCLHSRPDAFLDIVNDFKKLVIGPQRVPEIEFEVLYDLERLAEIMKQIPEDAPLVFDLENSNIDNERSTPKERWNSYILSFAFCWEPGQAYVISTELWNTVKCLKLMQPYMERKKGWIGHNVKFDILNVQEDYTRHLGIKPEIYADGDTLLMHYTLDERRGTHGLKILAGLFEDPGYDDVLRKYLKNKNDSYSKIPRDVLYRYNAKDVDYTLRLAYRFKKELREKNLYEWPYINIIMVSLQTLIDAESVGMFLHRDTLKDSREQLQVKVDTLRVGLRMLAEELELNPNSPQQVAKILYGKFGFSTPKGRSIKPGSTNKEALMKLQRTHNHPFVNSLIEYRRFNKLLTTYANKLDGYCDHEDFTHFDFNLAGTVTGRIEAGLLLTIPRAYTPEGKLIRNCFGAPDSCNQLHLWMKSAVDDYIWKNYPPKQLTSFNMWKDPRPSFMEDGCGLKIIDADFSQAELRLLGWFAEDEFLYDVYKNGRDLHSEATTKLFNIDYTDPLWKEQRMKAKMLNFAMAYSAMTSVNSFAQDTGVPVQEAREIIEAYNEVLFGVTAWKSEIVDQMKTTGWIRSPTGRYRRFPLITAKNEHELMNQAVNFLPQSLSNDITLRSFSKLTNIFKRRNLPVWPVLFLHDGIYFICLDDQPLIDEVSPMIVNVMEETAYEVQDMGLFPEYKDKPQMIFKADIGIKTRWG